jgi:transcriptional regulator with XRE-family HTH domain
MKLNENFTVAKGFESLFDFSEKDQKELDALWLAAQFLSIIQDEITLQQITRRELALRIGTSASWLTQVFRGDKLPNLETITQLQKALNIEFEIRQKNEVLPVSYEENEIEDKFKKIVKFKPVWFKGMMLENIDYDEISNELDKSTGRGKSSKYQEVA